MFKSRTLNELRQTRDAVYTLLFPTTNVTFVGDIYVILDSRVTRSGLRRRGLFDSARPKWSADALEAHFETGEERYTAPNGEVVHHVRRRKRRV